MKPRTRSSSIRHGPQTTQLPVAQFGEQTLLSVIGALKSTGHDATELAALKSTGHDATELAARTASTIAIGPRDLRNVS